MALQRFKAALIRCGIHSKPKLSVKSFPYIVFGTLATYACSCMRTHCLSVRTHTCVCVLTLQGFLWLFFSKNIFILPKISLYSINTFIKSIFMRFGPKPTLGFRVLSSLENGGLSHKGYKTRFPQLATTMGSYVMPPNPKRVQSMKD